jgi:hypothetical protein
MTAIALPANLTEALNALVIEAMLPDYFEYIQEEGVNCERGHDFAHNYKVESRYFVSNVKMMLGAGAALGVFFGVIWVLNKLNLPMLANVCGRILAYGHWKVLLRWWLQAYLHILMFSSLQLGITYSSDCLRSYYTDINLILSLFGLSFALITPLLLLVFLTTNRTKVTTRCDLSFNQRWDELYKALSPNSYTASLYPAIFILRRLLFGLSIALLYEWPKVQAVTGTALAFAVLLYVTICRPVEGKMEWISEIVVEIGTFVIFVLSACYAFDIGDKLKENMSGIAVWAVLGSVVCNGAVSLIKTIIAVYDVCKEYDLKRRVQPTHQFPALPNASMRATRVSSIRVP